MINPPITDGSGYRVAERDLEFLRIPMDHVRRWQADGTPLGLSPVQFEGFCGDLAQALVEDDVALADVDVRVKGSSASFFSGHHKAMPQNQSDIVDTFRAERGRFPRPWELAEIMRRLQQEWITAGPLPQRRPFDSLHRLKVARERSDYDVQISCDEILRRCEDLVRGVGQDPSEARIHHPTYDFVHKDLVAAALPTVDAVCLRLADALDRHVSLAVFPRAGPPDTSDTVGELSAHFRDTDLVLDLAAALRGRNG